MYYPNCMYGMAVTSGPENQGDPGSISHLKIESHISPCDFPHLVVAVFLASCCCPLPPNLHIFTLQSYVIRHEPDGEISGW